MRLLLRFILKFLAGVCTRFAQTPGRWKVTQVDDDMPHLIVAQGSSGRGHPGWRNPIAN